VSAAGDKNERNGATKQDFTNAEIGVVQEFGSISLKIPPRSFLRMPLESHINQIAAFFGQPKMVDLILSGNARKAFQLLGVFAKALSSRPFPLAALVNGHQIHPIPSTEAAAPR